MVKKITVVLAVFLAACSTTNNKEGKILDASSDYCREIRVDNPELYYETCETTGGWKTRDPKGYAKAHKPKSTSEAIIDDAIELAVEKTLKGAFDAID